MAKKDNLGTQQVNASAVPKAASTPQTAAASKPTQDVNTVSQTPATTTQAATNTPQQTTTQNNNALGSEQTTTQQTSTQTTQNSGYDKNTDYAALMNKAASEGNYALAAQYEQQRNAKIAGEGLNYEQTNQYASYLNNGNQQQTTTQQTSTQSYDKNTDYAALMQKAAASGDYISAAKYEQLRNSKIAGEGLNYAQTSQYADYLPGGAKYYSTLSQNGQSLVPLIEEQYDAALKQAQMGIDYNTQASVDQLNRALDDAQAGYDDAIADSYIQQLEAQEAQALYNQRQGDRGGIGSEQWTSIGNTYAKYRQEIAAEQRQLATDTARQIADLRAQGAYEEADALLTATQNKLSSLYTELSRMQEYNANQSSSLSSYGQTFLNAGIMPSDRMLEAMGLTKEEAQAYINAVNGTSGSSSSTYTYEPSDEPTVLDRGNVSEEQMKAMKAWLGYEDPDGQYNTEVKAAIESVAGKTFDTADEAYKWYVNIGRTLTGEKMGSLGYGSGSTNVVASGNNSNGSNGNSNGSGATEKTTISNYDFKKYYNSLETAIKKVYSGEATMEEIVYQVYQRYIFSDWQSAQIENLLKQYGITYHTED